MNRIKASLSLAIATLTLYFVLHSTASAYINVFGGPEYDASTASGYQYYYSPPFGSFRDYVSFSPGQQCWGGD